MNIFKKIINKIIVSYKGDAYNLVNSITFTYNYVNNNNIYKFFSKIPIIEKIARILCIDITFYLFPKNICKFCYKTKWAGLISCSLYISDYNKEYDIYISLFSLFHSYYKKIILIEYLSAKHYE